MIYFLSFFWFIRQTKAILFWLYLWQLKEYHIGRFLAHFQTEKGKRLIFDKLVVLKILLLFVYIVMGYISVNPGLFDTVLDFILLSSITILFAVYFLEGAKTIISIVLNKLLRPVFTKKIQFLIFIFLSFTIGFLLFTMPYFKRPLIGLLLFDILTPFIISLGVLFFQPLTVLVRNQIIKKARGKRKKFKNLLAIGITGSYGKTSTKEFLALILSEKFKVLKTKEHQNSEIGISRCILDDLNESHQIFIAEMGAYNRGGIKLLSDIVKPKIGILTGINQQHLATFGSKENIVRTKYELIESLPEQGVAIFNTNNEYCQQLYEKTKIPKKISSKDIWTEDIRVEKELISFKVFSKDGDSAFFKINLLGAQNIENIILAACCAKELGMNLEEIAKACQKIKHFFGGMKFLKGVFNLNIIDSTYSANPAGVISHLEYLGTWKGKKAIIMPCLIELGGSSRKVHGEIGQQIAKTCDLVIITTKECFPEIKRSALKTGMNKDNILFSENPKEIVERVKSFSGPEDIVLLEGRISKAIKKSLLS